MGTCNPDAVEMQVSVFPVDVTVFAYLAMDSELQIVGSRHALWGNPVRFPCFIALGIKTLRGEANSAYKKIRNQDQDVWVPNSITLVRF